MTIPLTTTTQLLEALRVQDDDGAWSLLVERYQPVLRGIGRRLGLRDVDAEDAAQQTLVDVVRGLREGRFDRERGGLRRWTLAILRRRISDIQRLQVRATRGVLEAGASGEQPLDDGRLDGLWNDELHRHILGLALARLRTETRLADATLRAFELTAVREVPVEAAAEECGMTREEVYVARNRVLSRLRTIIADLEAAMEAACHDWQVNFPPSYTPLMERLASLNDLLLVIITLICLFVLALLIYAVYRFHATRNPTATTTTHNTVLEIAWTVIPILILVVIAIPSFRLLYYSDKATEAALGIRLLDTESGGADGGGSHLPPQAREVCRRFRRMTSGVQEVITRRFQTEFHGNE